MLIWKLLRRLIPYALGLAVLTVVSLMIGRTIGTWMMDRAEPGSDVAPPGRMVTVGAHAVHVVERGTGPAIVLLHGVPGSAADWPDAFVDRLAATHRVIAIDLLGFGWSARPVDVGMTAWGAQVVGTLGALGITDATAVGHDAGAAAAIAAAVESPATVSRLVLVAAAVPVDEDALSWRAFLPLVPGAGEVMAGWSADLLRPADTPPGIGTGPWWNVPGTRRTTLAALRAGIPPEELTRAVKSVAVPALVLHGTADPVVPWPVARRWIPSIDGALVRLLEGGGHWLVAERPDAVADAVLAFMEGGT